MYTDECGTVGSIQFTMQSDNPQVGDTPDSYCDFHLICTQVLSLIKVIGVKFLPLMEKKMPYLIILNLKTQLLLSNYGSYTFAYNSCGGYEEVEIEFIRDPNVNFVATYNECEQNALLFVDIPEGIDGNFYFNKWSRKCYN